MRIALHYDQRSYGNEYPNENYVARVLPPTPSSNDIELTITFPQTAPGRGRNLENFGSVNSLSLQLSSANARKIAAAILWQLERSDPALIELFFGKTSKVA